MKYTSILLIFLVPFFLQARVGPLECTTSASCKYADSFSPKKCVSKINLYFDSTGQGTEVISYTPARLGAEIFLKGDNYPVVSKVELIKGKTVVTFQDQTGDQWGQLASDGYGNFIGNITVDQDFPFNVTCLDKSIGFE